MRHLRNEGRATALLVGAGISASAGIPMAGKIADDIRRDPRYNYRLDDLQMNPELGDYNSLMRALTYKQREELLRGYIDEAKINLAHLYIGMLIKEGYVSSVLTTNFDPLLVRTMALFNQHIYVYDLANIRDYVSDSVMYPNIFYLHGQGHAFLMLNTPDELQLPGKYFSTLVNDMMQRHFFLVVGYSGLSDFIFDKLCTFPRYSSDLIWVGYKSEQAPNHVRQQLCNKDSVRYINSNGADSFFRDLVNELGIDTPPFLERPFEYLKSLLSNIGDLQYDDGSELQKFDLLKQPLRKIEMAIELVEKGEVKNIDDDLKKMVVGKLENELMSLHLQSRYDDIIARAEEIKSYNNASLNEQLIRAYSVKAGKLFEEGDVEEGERHYALAQALMSDNYAGYYNWGTDLVKTALQRDSNETLFRRAFEKFSWALKVNPDGYHALANWGNGLLRSYAKTGYKPYLTESIEKMEAANALAPHICDYSLACAAALQNQTEKAFELLESSFSNKTVNDTRPQIEKDPDLDSIRNDPRFLQLLNQYLPLAGQQVASA